MRGIKFYKFFVDRRVRLSFRGFRLHYSCSYCNGEVGYPCYTFYSRGADDTVYLSSFLICSYCFDIGVIRILRHFVERGAGLVACHLCTSIRSRNMTPSLSNLTLFHSICDVCLQGFEGLDSSVGDLDLDFHHVVWLFGDGSKDVKDVAVSVFYGGIKSVDLGFGVEDYCFKRGYFQFSLPSAAVGNSGLVRYYFYFDGGFSERVDRVSLMSVFPYCWLCYGASDVFYWISMRHTDARFLLCEGCYEYLSCYNYRY